MPVGQRNRRALIAALGGVAIFCLPYGRVSAQRSRQSGSGIATIGVLSPFSQADTESWHQAFRQGLHDLAWVEGANLRIEYRFADGKSERLPELVEQLIKLKPDIIVVAVTADAIAAAKATKTIPIVVAAAGDPVAVGLVSSLAHPGGNVTGLSGMSTDLAGKWLELLKEVVPDLSRVATLWSPSNPISALVWRQIQDSAPRLGIESKPLQVEGRDEFEGAFARAIDDKAHAIIATPAPVFVDNEKLIADFALANRLPSIFHLPEFVRLGGLLAYGPDRSDLFRRTASYVDKILKGTHPSDLPIEQPTKFEMAVSSKTAKAIGLDIPPTLLARADEVIE